MEVGDEVGDTRDGSQGSREGSPYTYLGPMAVQIRGQGALSNFVLSHHVRMVNGALLVRNP
jgi:hypothetical protein